MLTSLSLSRPVHAATITYQYSGRYLGADSPGVYVYVRHCKEGYCYPGRYLYHGYNSIDYNVWCYNGCAYGGYHYFMQIVKHHFQVIVKYGRWTPFDLQAGALQEDYEFGHHSYAYKKDEQNARGAGGDSCIAGYYDLLLCQARYVNISYWDPYVIGVAGVTSTGYENTGYSSVPWGEATTGFGN